jgi:hypothetical protein
MKKTIAGILLAAMCSGAMADISESDLADLKGYTILGSWTVTGWYDPSKDGKKGDSFDGCEYDRVIILDDSLKVTCTEYSYSYSYRPRAIIFGNGTSLKMLLGGHLYSVRK